MIESDPDWYEFAQFSFSKKDHLNVTIHGLSHETASMASPVARSAMVRATLTVRSAWTRGVQVLVAFGAALGPDVREVDIRA